MNNKSEFLLIKLCSNYKMHLNFSNTKPKQYVNMTKDLKLLKAAGSKKIRRVILNYSLYIIASQHLKTETLTD